VNDGATRDGHDGHETTTILIKSEIRKIVNSEKIWRILNVRLQYRIILYSCTLFIYYFSKVKELSTVIFILSTLLTVSIQYGRAYL
jgi:hypothetical protein